MLKHLMRYTSLSLTILPICSSKAKDMLDKNEKDEELNEKITTSLRNRDLNESMASEVPEPKDYKPTR